MTVPYVAATDRYKAMPYRRVGASGLRLPAISLGLWQNFGDERALATQRAIIRRAFDRGVTHSTWPTTTARRTARRRPTSGASWPPTCARTATS